MYNNQSEAQITQDGQDAAAFRAALARAKGKKAPAKSAKVSKSVKAKSATTPKVKEHKTAKSAAPSKTTGSGAMIRALLAKGVKPAQVVADVLKAFPDHVTTVKDVYWQRWAMKAGRFA